MGGSEDISGKGRAFMMQRRVPGRMENIPEVTWGECLDVPLQQMTPSATCCALCSVFWLSFSVVHFMYITYILHYYITMCLPLCRSLQWLWCTLGSGIP